ncbi:hypothetical protein [Actinoplanes sp. NPDC049118]|uniref:hypothetical protein n=1 Tax=Actinoplanes sp. NPDC049118 TaxID=3155769 RepID=UPI0034065A4E
MAADYYYADTENGDHLDDPSEDALFMLLDDLEPDGNTFLTVRPADGAGWSVSVSLLDDGGFRVERGDPARGEHAVYTTDDLSRIAGDLTIWMAGRT